MSYSTIEPTVIDEDLVRKAINEQVNPLVADIAKREGIESGQVLHLRLDYKNILKIDNLWIYENLTKLQLDNNVIEKIENLHFLKNLEWLDLSFNNITVIEGLDTLVKLTDLSLFSNRISKLENMDTLINLEVFSIGNNNISDMDNLEYLLQFEKLRVLHLAGNPIQNYKPYCLAHFDNLKYLDYRLFDADAVEKAKEMFKESVARQEEKQRVSKEKMVELNRRNEIKLLREKAHISNLNKLSDIVMNQHLDYSHLLKIDPAIYNQSTENFRTNLEVVIKDLEANVLQKYKETEEERVQLKNCLDDAKETADTESKARLHLFFKQKKEAIQISKNPAESEEKIKKLKSLTQKISDYLLNTEMVVTEQFEDVLAEYERNITDIVTSVISVSTSSFTKLRESEKAYGEKIKEFILLEQQNIAVGDSSRKVGENKLDDSLGDLLKSVESSHKSCEMNLTEIERILVNGWKSLLENSIKDAQNSELERNRARISEIVSLVHNCQTEMDQAENS